MAPGGDVNSDRPTLAYATPDPSARPSVALWIGASLVWACVGLMAASLIATVLSYDGFDRGTAVALVVITAVFGGIAMIERHAVLGRSVVATWCIAGPACFMSLGGCFSIVRGVVELALKGRSLLTMENVVIALSFLLFYSGVVLIAITHVRWARRLSRERMSEPE